MSKDQSPKPEKQHIEKPEINKGHDAEKSGFEKLHYPDSERSIQEGYQPVRDIVSTPPDGGSGVPDKD